MKYMILVLALTGCCFKSENQKISQTEFTFKQKVRVIDGFYKGHTGTVVEQGIGYSDCHRTYGVYLDDDTEGRVPGEQVICNSKLEAL